jgi:anti-sigma factor RsiW
MTHSTDHAVREWLDLELDGESLEPAARQRVSADLEKSPDLQVEKAELEKLHRLLLEGRIPAPRQFSQRVMANLPAAPWEVRSTSAWRLPVAVLLLLGSISAALLGLGSAALSSSASAWSAAKALVDLFAAALVSGAGLLTASWRGLRFALLDMLTASPLGWVALFSLVVGVNLLLIAMIRRRKPLPAEAEKKRTD